MRLAGTLLLLVVLVPAPPAAAVVKIGSKSVIGAGSVVTRDIPDGVFAAGNPCRVIRGACRWAPEPFGGWEKAALRGGRLYHLPDDFRFPTHRAGRPAGS